MRPTSPSLLGWIRPSFKFSLRLLLVAVAIFGVWLAVLGRQAGHERDARRAIAPLASDVHYDYQIDPEGKFDPDAEPAWTIAIHETIGDEYFCRMHTVMFSRDVTDSDMLAIRDALQRSSLQSINLAPCRQFSDDGLSAISELGDLRDLDLRDTAVTNDGLKLLRNLPNLRELQLGNIGFRRPALVNDEGLAVLADLPRLEAIYLWGNGFTDAGLIHVKDLPDLHLLWFQQTRVSPNAIRELRRLQKLEVLALEGCDVGDAELSELLAFPHLKRLYLDGANVTDASTKTLTQLRGLERLSLGRTRMTATALAEVQKALPNCEIQ